MFARLDGKGFGAGRLGRLAQSVLVRDMDKADAKHEVQSDTSSVINMKEVSYAPSEYPSSEAPPVPVPYHSPNLGQTISPILSSEIEKPKANNWLKFGCWKLLTLCMIFWAYMKPRQNSLRIARLAAFTVIASAVILGSFILAASWIQANTARNLDLTLNQELMDDLHPTYEHLVANELLPEQQDNSINQDATPEKKAEEEQQSLGDHQQPEQEPDTRQQMGQQEGGNSLELDAIANVLMQKGMRGNVNCIVEKRRNEELVDHAPRAINLPGLNITTPPRLQHLTGEQVVIICKDDNSEEKEEAKEEPEQPMILPIPPQMLQQLQSTQMIPLDQILQQIQAQQGQPIFLPQQPQEQIYYQPQAQPQPQQQMFYQRPPPQQQQVFFPQPQQQVFYQQQPQQEQVFMPHPNVIHRQQNQFPLQEQVPQQAQQPAVPLRRVPLSQLMNQRPINPMAIQDVPISQMPLTHMPMRDARMPEQPVPVHHLVPPRPQQVRIENFSQDEDVPIPAMIRQRLLEREREMMPNREREMPRNIMTEAHPRPLPLESREPRLMTGPVFPINDNSLPQDAPRQPFTPTRRFRFPESNEPQGMAITRIIPIRLEKIENESDEETNTNNDENRRPPPIPLNAILDMVFKGMRPFIGRQPFPVPIDIKIERIEKPMPMTDSSAETEESQESQEGHDNQEETENMEEKPQAVSQPQIQQVEVVEKEGENTQPIPIPADAQDAQVFKLEEKPEGEWAGRAFLPNGLGRGGVFPIPQGVREAQIFTVSDARAGVPMSASYETAPATKEEDDAAREGGAMGQPEGEVNLFPVPMNAEKSVRLYPVEEQNDKPQNVEKVESQQEEAGRTSEIVQPR